MATITAIVTNEGLTKLIEAANNEGWYIFPTTFSVSNQQGDFNAARTQSSMLPTWYEAPISSRVPIFPHAINFICTIPPGSQPTDMDVKEVYLMAEDMLGNDFLLAIGQTDDPEGVWYDKDGSLTFKLIIVLQNLDLTELIQINYTQATEISEHNRDPRAHPELQDAMSKAAIFVNSSDFAYEGQMWDEKAVFAGGVEHGMFVVKEDDGLYHAAIASGSEPSAVGMAHFYKFARPWVAGKHYLAGYRVMPTAPNQHTYICISGGETSSGSEPLWPIESGSRITDGDVIWEENTRNIVLLGGLATIPGSYPTGDWLYLSNTVPGALTTSKTRLKSALSLGEYEGLTLVAIRSLEADIPGVFSTEFTLDTWIASGDEYYADIDTSGYETSYPVVKFYDEDTGEEVLPDIRIMIPGSIRVFMPINTMTLRAIVVG